MTSLMAFLKSSWRLIVLFLAILLSYLFFLSTARIQNFILFHPKETVSWVTSGSSLYRVAAKGNLDNMILTEERFREVVLNLRIAHPHDCGFIYDYEDAQNYQFIFLDNQVQRIIAGTIQQGKTRILQNQMFGLEVFPSFQFEKQASFVRLLVNGQEVMKFKTEEKAGRVGLILNGIHTPQTIFHNITARGILENGQKVRAQDEQDPNAGLQKIQLSFLLFFILVGVGILFVQPAVLKGCLSQIHPGILHFGLACAFFWPFVTQGQVAIFSYDNLGEIFPLLYYSKHNFENLLHGQAPWMWNSLIHNGFPFCFNHWDMIYYPLNWPIFLVPDQHFMLAVTFKSFVEVVGIGILGYGFFVRELGSPRWALFASSVYQLCSLLIFTMSVFPATSLYFSMTFYLYVLWSAQERSLLKNILWLTVAIVFVLTSANVAFIFYGCLSLGVITLYRWISLRRANAFWFFKMIASAWVLGFLISAVRIFSCLEGVMSSNRMAENFHTIHDRFYMILRLFIPEMAGWLGPQTFPVLMSSNLNLIFRQLDLPSNAQNNFFIYFGIIPALLLLIGFFVKVPAKFQFWKIYSLIVLAIGLLWQPVWGVLSILSFPLNHYSYHSVIIPVGICMLAGSVGLSWEMGQLTWEQFRKPFLIAVGLVVSLFCVFETYLFPQLTMLTRIILIIIGLLLAGYSLIKAFVPNYSRTYLQLLRWGMAVASIAALVFLTMMLLLKPIPHKIQVSQGLILPIYWGLVFIVVWLNLKIDEQKILGVGSYLVAGAVGLILTQSTLGTWFLEQPQALLIYGLDVGLGSVRFLLMLQVFLLGVVAANQGALKITTAGCLFFVVTIFDLIAFNARFNDITAPFYFHQAFYPKAFYYRDLNPNFKKEVDVVNYRVNNLHRQDCGANKNLVFNIPSYTGTVGYMTKRFSTLLSNFGYPQGIYMLYPEDSTDNARFLDLSAVGYEVQDRGVISRRPTALARLNLFYSAQMIPDDQQVLSRLKEESFNPLQTVLLSTTSVERGDNANELSHAVPLSPMRPDRVEAKFQNRHPAWLVFVESFHEGWKAFVDEREVPVIRANYNFMACEIKAPGSHTVRFEFMPKSYFRNLTLSGLGLIVFFFVFVTSWFMKEKKNH